MLLTMFKLVQSDPRPGVQSNGLNPDFHRGGVSFRPARTYTFCVTYVSFDFNLFRLRIYLDIFIVTLRCNLPLTLCDVADSSITFSFYSKATSIIHLPFAYENHRLTHHIIGMFLIVVSFI